MVYLSTDIGLIICTCHVLHGISYIAQAIVIGLGIGMNGVTKKFMWKIAVAMATIWRYKYGK